jgi:hypothetical protein
MCTFAKKMLDYRTIRTERQFKDSTGYSKKAFESLLLDFEKEYKRQNEMSYETHLEKNVVEDVKLKTLGDILFFVLFQLKNGLIWGSLGVVFNMSVSTAHHYFEAYSKLLEQTLEKKSNSEA